MRSSFIFHKLSPCQVGMTKWMGRGVRDTNKQACGWISRHSCQQHVCHRQALWQFGWKKKTWQQNNTEQTNRETDFMSEIYLGPPTLTFSLIFSLTLLVVVAVCLFPTNARTQSWASLFDLCGVECQARLITLGSTEEDTACHCASLKAPQQWPLHSHTSFNPPTNPRHLSSVLLTPQDGSSLVGSSRTGFGPCGGVSFR